MWCHFEYLSTCVKMYHGGKSWKLTLKVLKRYLILILEKVYEPRLVHRKSALLGPHFPQFYEGILTGQWFGLNILLQKFSCSSLTNILPTFFCPFPDPGGSFQSHPVQPQWGSPGVAAWYLVNTLTLRMLEDQPEIIFGFCPCWLLRTQYDQKAPALNVSLCCLFKFRTCCQSCWLWTVFL